MSSQPEPRTFALVAHRLGFLDEAQHALLCSLVEHPEFVAKLITDVGLSPDQVWAVYRSLERVPCPSCGHWSRIAGAIPGGKHPCDGCAAPLRISPRLGSLVNPLGERMGPWQLVSLLGSGGRGRVYRALHVREKRACALKLLDRALTSRPEYVQRFEREARVMRELDHPNVVGITDHGEHGGVHYLAMELLAGESLTQRIQRRARLDLASVLDLARQVGRGLAALHALGVVHRDLKPDNIMCVHDRYVVVDFGLTKGFDSTDSLNMTLTKTGMVVGTPMYMAPEQCTGKHVDARADLYAFGLVLHASITGRAPFADRDAAALMQHQMLSPLDPLPKDLCPPALDAIISRLAEKQPDARYPSAEAMLVDLEACAIEVRGAPVDSDAPLAPLIAPTLVAGRMVEASGGGAGEPAPPDVDPVVSPPSEHAPLAKSGNGWVALFAALAFVALAAFLLRGRR